MTIGLWTLGTGERAPVIGSLGPGSKTSHFPGQTWRRLAASETSSPAPFTEHSSPAAGTSHTNVIREASLLARTSLFTETVFKGCSCTNTHTHGRDLIPPASPAFLPYTTPLLPTAHIVLQLAQPELHLTHPNYLTCEALNGHNLHSCLNVTFIFSYQAPIAIRSTSL